MRYYPAVKHTPKVTEYKVFKYSCHAANFHSHATSKKKKKGWQKKKALSVYLAP